MTKAGAVDGLRTRWESTTFQLETTHKYSDEAAPTNALSLAKLSTRVRQHGWSGSGLYPQINKTVLNMDRGRLSWSGASVGG